jgi:hypothetical protein
MKGSTVLIHSYWEGEMSQTVKQCLARFQAAFGDRFTHHKQWSDDWGSYPDCAVNYRGDLAKWSILFQQGGIVIDLDCVVMRDPLLVCVEPLTLFRDRPGNMVDAGFMAAKYPGHPLVGYFRELAWLKYKHKLLDHYTALSKHVVCSYPLKVPANDPIMPIHWRESSRFRETGSDEKHRAQFDTQAVCYMLTRGSASGDAPAGSFLSWLFQQPYRHDKDNI